MAGVIDIAEEIARLDKELMKHEKERDHLQQKLSNPQFVTNAPKEVVAKEEARVQEIQTAIDILKKQQERLSAS